MTARDRARRFAFVSLVVVALVALRAAGDGDLATPPFTSFDRLQDWAATHHPATIAIALVRAGAELSAWYLLGLGVLHGVAAVSRVRGVGRLADVLALGRSATLVRAGLGVGLLATTPLGTAADAGPDRSTATMRPYADDRGTARMVPATTTVPTTTTTTTAPPPTATAESSGATQAPAGPNPETGGGTWAVARGESLWSIADDVVAETSGQAARDRDVDPYWRALIAANRHRLVDRDDPDLIHPGQVFELPPLPLDGR